MLGARLFVAQRLSAVVMAPLAAAHLLGIFYAIHGGLDAAEILSRTQGSVWFGVFYQVFVIAASLHAAIGIRVVACEWAGARGRFLDLITWLSGLLLLAMGSFAVSAVVFP